MEHCYFFTKWFELSYLLQGHKIFKDYYKIKERILEEDNEQKIKGCFDSIRKRN
jgi:hypothetical protein